jgi:hypothetical protein
MKVQGSACDELSRVGFKIQDSGLKELINDMKIFRITKFDFINNTPIDLRGMHGRQIEKIDLMAVSLVKRAAEGEIYNVTLF